jgi:hypothetical protein
VKRAIHDCGAVYIGFDVPAWLMEGEPPVIWDSRGRSDTKTVGGHAVSCHGYDAKSVGLISWGQKYRMTWGMWDEVVREAYALIHPWWIEATGLTPFGISEEQLRSQMTAFCRGRITG